MTASECLSLPSPQATGCLHDPLAGAALCPLPVAMATQAAGQPWGWGRPCVPALPAQAGPELSVIPLPQLCRRGQALSPMNPRAESLDPKKAPNPPNS